MADVISVMAGATNSTASEVVDYLEAHGVNAHLPIFYMDDYYSFNSIDEWLCQVGENDAKTTYFRASDVMSFEPITKHGIFNDKPATVVNDVYGRTYDINQHKKNREDDYLTLAETLSFLNYNDYDYVRLRDIARRKLITPCFYFDGYVGSFRGDTDDSDNGFYTEVIAGYFTYRALAEAICSDDDYMRLPNDGVMIYSVLEKKTAAYVDGDDVFLFYDKPQGLEEAEKFKLAHIDAGEIRFSKRALDSYIASIQNTSDNHFIEHVKLVEGDKVEQLETKNDELNARLNKASDIYRQNQNEIKELKAQLEKANADSAALNEKLSIADAALAAAQSTVEQPQGFDRYNARRGSFITTGKAVARYLWSIDTTQAIRTGDMVQQLITIMHDIDASLLPDEAAIRVWLSDVAPDYAKKAGKTPNNAPKIIPLDMKR